MKSLRKHATIDRGAGVTGAILAILGVFDVAARLGISGDDLAVVLGAAATIGAELRHQFEARAKGAPDTSSLNELNSTLRDEVSGADNAQQEPDESSQEAP